MASEASVKAIRDQSEAMLRPYITVAPFVQPQSLILFLRIRNTGRTGAKNVRLGLDKDFFQFGQKSRSEVNLRTLSAFSVPMDCMAPGAELIFALAQGDHILGDASTPAACPAQFSVTSIYEFSGKRVEEVNHVDLRPYIGSSEEGNPIVNELENIRKVMEKKY